MIIPNLDIMNLTQLVFTVFLIVLLPITFILVGYKKLRKAFIVLLFIVIVATTHM
ncbi:MAG: hypothetical protein KGD70_13500 [Candidatus Lokiarchaeota archaeon]|nr:hypothetical protein [Candidatus Lokiarchaeota archaeon]